jgi:beta-glucosidase-like glycosyl hydrolase
VLTTVLRGEFGYGGFVGSDWFGNTKVDVEWTRP